MLSPVVITTFEPILANQGDGDVEFSTNVVTLSTILFIIVVPIVVTLLG